MNRYGNRMRVLLGGDKDGETTKRNPQQSNYNISQTQCIHKCKKFLLLPTHP